MSNDGTPRLKVARSWDTASLEWRDRHHLEEHDHHLVVTTIPCCNVCQWWCVRWYEGTWPNGIYRVACVVSHERPTMVGNVPVVVVGGPYPTPTECDQWCSLDWWCVQYSDGRRCEQSLHGQSPPYAVSGPYISELDCEQKCTWWWCIRTFHNGQYITESCVASATRPVVGANQQIVGGPWNTQKECQDWGCWTACGYNVMSCDLTVNDPYCCECWIDDCSATGTAFDCDGWWFPEWDGPVYYNGKWDPLDPFPWGETFWGRSYFSAYVGTCLLSQPSGGPLPGRFCQEHRMRLGFTIADSERPSYGANESNAGSMTSWLNNQDIGGFTGCTDGGSCGIYFYAGPDFNAGRNPPHIWHIGGSGLTPSPGSPSLARGRLPIWVGAGDRLEMEWRITAPNTPAGGEWTVRYELRNVRIYRNNAVAWSLTWDPFGTGPFPMIFFIRRILANPPTFCRLTLQCQGLYVPPTQQGAGTTMTACDDCYVIKGICVSPTMPPPPPPPPPS